MNTMVLLWLCAALSALLFELVTAGFFFGVALAMGATAGAYAAWSGVDGLMQSVVFLGVLFVGVMWSRFWITRAQPQSLQTNCAALIGRHGIVTAPIADRNISGLVKVRGEVWSAYALHEQNIPAGATVEIMAVHGCHLIVKEIDRT